MTIEYGELVWLDSDNRVSLAELARMSGLSESELEELAELGLLRLAEPRERPRAFSASCVTIARTASRLRSDFELDPDALALVVRLLARIGDLEAELLGLRARAPRHQR